MADQFDLLDLIKAAEAQPQLDELFNPDQIFETTNVDLLIRLSEGDRLERKSSKVQPKDLAPAFSAFSNGPSTRGGVLIFGIADKTREVEGCQSLSEERLQNIESAAMVFCPSARVMARKLPVLKADGQPDFVLLFRVSYVPDRLVALTDGRAFERIGDKTKELDDVRKQQLRVDKGERHFEIEACNLSYPDSFDRAAIRTFCDRIRAARGTSAQHLNEQILESMRLGVHVEGKFVPNNACVILFAKDPRRIFPGALVHFLKYKGTEELSGRDYNVEKDRYIDGNIATIIRDASAVIDANLQEFTEWTGFRFETTVEYPKDAWYELLVNACVHRSYMMKTMPIFMKTMPIFVKMFDDRIVFQSPGGLMPGVTPTNIYERHHPRNRIVMDALRETGEVRCINEGTKRVRLEMKRARLPEPQFRDEPGEGSSVFVTLFNNASVRANSLGPKAFAAIGEAAAKQLTEEERKIVDYIARVERTSVSSIMALLGETRWHTTNLKLNRLVRQGVLLFNSTKKRDPNAHYTLRKREEDEKPETAT